MVKYYRGLNYPNEGFVQIAIEKYFKDHGYKIINERYADLTCFCKVTNKKWIIEAKGETSSIGLDFRTGLGQLIQGMDNPEVNYAMAVPKTRQFIEQCRKLSRWVRIALNINLLFIDKQGRITFIAPQEDISISE